MEGSLYQGITLHNNLLEKVDLLNFVFDEEGEGGVKGTEKPMVRAPDPSSDDENDENSNSLTTPNA